MMALFGYRRPDFGNYTLRKQIYLLDHHRKQINKFLEAQKNHMSLLEYGTPKGIPTRVVERAQDQVKAAVLKDVEDLSPLEISDRLGIQLNELQKQRYENGDWKIPEVNGLIDDGRFLLDNALRDEGGWQKHVEDMKAEAERYRSLSEEEKVIEALAESMKWTVEEARSVYQSNPEVARFLLDTSVRF